MPSPDRPRIVIVGGGAGGLELATRLGRRLGRRGRAHITLVDSARWHLWKPHLHEVASGSLDAHTDKISYLEHGSRHGYQFRLGRMTGLDRSARTIALEAVLDEAGMELIPAQDYPYDLLVLAVGSQTNDFGTPGVSQHCLQLDTTEQALRFHHILINACLRAAHHAKPAGHGRYNVVIIGGGATGVELAAELHHTAQILSGYGLQHLNPDHDVKIHIVEAADRILAALPEKTSLAAAQALRGLNVDIHSNERVVEVQAQQIRMSSGKILPADMTVWAAGIKCGDYLKDLGGLSTNRLNQFEVLPTLQTTHDPSIFAMGDCAACLLPNSDRPVPPKAQAASQQATFLAENLMRHLAGQPLRAFRYREYGSLVSLGIYTSVGHLMGSLARGNLFVEGHIAKVMYWSLYKQHQLVVHGWVRTALATYTEFIGKIHRPPLKLH